LHWGLDLLEALTTSPIVEVDASVVTAARQHIILVQGQGIYDGVVVVNGPQLVTLWLLPNTDLVGAS
jgi:hypothetical protein